MPNKGPTSNTGGRFFGRERIVRDMVTGLLGPQPGSFSLVGSKMVGKSHLLDYLAAPDGPLLGESPAALRPYPFADPSQILPLKINCDWPDAQRDFLGYLAERLLYFVREEENIQLDWSAFDEQSGPGRRIWTLARRLNQQGYRLILLLDNFDTVFTNQLLSAHAIDELRPLTLEMALVVATEQPLHDLDRELAASPLFNVMTQLFIGLLEPDAARIRLQRYAESHPGLDGILGELATLTGNHPFLLERIDDILSELQPMLPASGTISPDFLPLIRLRLAEHGRLLFATHWRMLDAPPRRMDGRPIHPLITRLTEGPLSVTEIRREQFPILNWLINQAVVTFDPQGEPPGYRLYSPLFAEFLVNRPLNGKEPGESTAHPGGSYPDPSTASSGFGGETPGNRAVGTRTTGDRAAVTPVSPIFDQLTKTESALLRYFQTNSGQVVSPEDLLAHVWKRPDASARRVQEAIRRLRLQLESADPPVGSIENERGRGYRFVPASPDR